MKFFLIFIYCNVCVLVTRAQIKQDTSRDETLKQEIGILQRMLYLNSYCLRLILVFGNNLKCITLKLGKQPKESGPWKYWFLDFLTTGCTHF